VSSSFTTPAAACQMLLVHAHHTVHDCIAFGHNSAVQAVEMALDRQALWHSHCHAECCCLCMPLRFDIGDKGLPFFVFFYIDEHIAVAKGRGGGWAYWRRMDPAEELKYGIV
jgi:hypothetical protein